MALVGGALLQGTSATRVKKSLYANVALVVPGTANLQDNANGCSKHMCNNYNKKKEVVLGV